MSDVAEIAGYWDRKFEKQKLIWGLDPSPCAVEGASWLAEKAVRSGAVLDLGCGYARDSGYLATSGFQVTGLDISQVAIEQARTLYPEIAFRIMDISYLDLPSASFEAAFGNFILHLFSDPKQRRRILSEVHRVLQPGGTLFITVASVDDADYGQGEEVGTNLFRNERGVVKYYYNQEAIHDEFSSFSSVQVREIVENHTHDRPHSHNSYLIIAQKEKE